MHWRIRCCDGDVASETLGSTIKYSLPQKGKYAELLPGVTRPCANKKPRPFYNEARF